MLPYEINALEKEFAQKDYIQVNMKGEKVKEINYGGHMD